MTSNVNDEESDSFPDTIRSASELIKSESPERCETKKCLRIHFSKVIKPKFCKTNKCEDEKFMKDLME